MSRAGFGWRAVKARSDAWIREGKAVAEAQRNAPVERGEPTGHVLVALPEFVSDKCGEPGCRRRPQALAAWVEPINGRRYVTRQPLCRQHVEDFAAAHGLAVPAKGAA